MMNILAFDSIKENRDIVDEITDVAYQNMIVTKNLKIKPSEKIMKEAHALYSVTRTSSDRKNPPISFIPVIAYGTSLDHYAIIPENSISNSEKDNSKEDLLVTITPKSDAKEEATMFLETENRLASIIEHMIKINGYLSSGEAKSLSPMLKQLIINIVNTNIKHTAHNMTTYKDTQALINILNDAASNAYFRNNITDHDRVQSSSTIDKYISYNIDIPKNKRKKINTR